MAGLYESSLSEMRQRLAEARDRPETVLTLAGECLDMAARMSAKAEKLARLGDRTQARMVDLNRRLRQQEERYRGIFENSTEGIFLADHDGRLMAANPALIELLWPDAPRAPSDAGPPPELSAMEALFFDPADYGAFAQTLRERGRVKRLEARLRTPRGPVWCLLGASRIEPDGHVVGMAQDISARKSLEEELLRRAATDALTGLANRRGFFDNAARAVSARARSRQPLCLIMIDVDHFKAVNDSHGHDAGDMALRAVGERLRRAVRGADLVARIGGEEFAVLCPQTDLDGGLELAERLRRAVRDRDIDLAGPPVRLTVSLGVAEFDPRLDRDASQCLSRADKALYLAKHAGRDQVRRAGGTGPADPEPVAPATGRDDA